MNRPKPFRTVKLSAGTSRSLFRNSQPSTSLNLWRCVNEIISCLLMEIIKIILFDDAINSHLSTPSLNHLSLCWVSLGWSVASAART